MDLHLEDDADFVSVYIDDTPVYSRTLEQHLDYLKAVMDWFIQAGLKSEVSYFKHVIT